MAIQALQAGVNVPQLCRNLVEDPQEVANSHNRMGTLYKVAAVIVGLAAVAIFTGTAAIWLGLLAAPEWTLVVGALLSILASKVTLGFWDFGNERYANANEYQLIADKLNADDADGGVGDWTALEIGAFFNEQGLLPHLFTEEAMEAMNRKSPIDHRLFALLPLIARYKVLSEQAEKMKQAYDRNIQLAQNFLAPGKEDLETRHRFAAMNVAEELAYIQLNRAVILENLRFPDREYSFGDVFLKRQLDDGKEEIIQAEGLNISGEEHAAGILLKKNVQVRAVDYIADRPREYFHTNGHVSITIEELRDSEPREIRERIFDAPAAAPEVPPLVV